MNHQPNLVVFYNLEWEVMDIAQCWTRD